MGKHQNQSRKLNPVPKGVAQIYGLIAVLIVLIPEWLAETVLALSHSSTEKSLPKKGILWEEIPELQLAEMNIRDLRNLAMRLQLHGYSNENRNALSKRVLIAFKRKGLKSLR